MNREELIDKMVAAIEKMKEETNKGVIKDYEKKYKEVLEVAKRKLCFNKAGMVDSFTPNDIYEMFPELKEGEDERIELLNYLYDVHDDDEERARWIAWLEKQGEHANFRNKIQIGDKVTRNKDGVLVNLSQLKRVAKKQGEQKPAEWTHKDGKNLAELWEILSVHRNTNPQVDNLMEWVKDLVSYKRQELSEEDEKMLNDIIKDLVHPWDEYIPDRIEDEIKWLKNKLNSLRPHSQWKPSDEQMNNK